MTSNDRIGHYSLGCSKCLSLSISPYQQCTLMLNKHFILTMLSTVIFSRVENYAFSERKGTSQAMAGYVAARSGRVQGADSPNKCSLGTPTMPESAKSWGSSNEQSTVPSHRTQYSCGTKGT